MRDIKKEYKKYVIIYFVLYIIADIIIIFSSNISLPNIKLILENKMLVELAITIVITPILSILSLIVLNIVPTKIKNLLVFWKIKESLPSYRWKSILCNDDRMDTKKIENKFGKNLSAQEQHNLWYKLYTNNKSDIRILNSQKDYLFARDLSIATVILSVIISIFSIVGFLTLNLPIRFLFNNLLILGIIYFILILVSRNSASRFICNVLIVDNSRNEEI